MTYAYHPEDVKDLAAEQAIVPADPARMQVLLVVRSAAQAEAMKLRLEAAGDASAQCLIGALTDAVASTTLDWQAYDFVIFEAASAAADLEALGLLFANPAANLHAVALVSGQVPAATREAYLSAGVQNLMPLTDLLPEPEVKPEPAQVAPAAITATPVATGKTAQITPVLRARGGAGATTIAINLATDLAMTAAQGEKVLLLDFDIQNGSVATALDLADSTAFTAMIGGQSALDLQFLEAAVVVHSSGLHVLPAPDVFAPLAALTPAMVEDLLTLLAPRYDHILIDMPQAITDWMEPVLSHSARVIIVTDTAVPSIKRCKRLIDLIADEHMTLPISVAINQEKRPFMLKPSQKEAARTLGRPLDHWIPSDPRAARRAMDLGVPMRLGAKRSAVSKAVAALAKTLRKPVAPKVAGK
ncbi:MAG: AAA family ATPase [Cypionkella sp.]